MISSVALLACAVAMGYGQSVTFAPDRRQIDLDEIGLYRVGYQYRGASEVAFSPGWSAHFEEKTGVSCLPFGHQDGRAAFLIHCPWRGGTGIAFQEFHIRMPRSPRITLRGSTAIRTDVVGKSDGAVFRILANGQTILRRHQSDAQWQDFELDLTRYAGHVLRLRFETDPGPEDNPGYDYTLWSGRAIIVEGLKTAQPRPTPRSAVDLTAHIAPTAQPGKRATGSVVPSSGWVGSRAVRVSRTSATLAYAGPDGRFAYHWRPGGGGLGSFEVTVQRKGRATVTLPLVSFQSIRWTEAAALSAGSITRTPSGVSSTWTVRTAHGSGRWTVHVRLIGKSLVLDVFCNRPWIESFDAGRWGPVLRRRPIPVPYYGLVEYLPKEDLFAHRFLDWTASSASSHSDGIARYEPLTDGTRRNLRERIIYTAATELVETLPNIPNPPSPFRRRVAERIVLDIWGGEYRTIARKLEELHSHGIRRCIAIVHDWQRSGYDNALPTHLPAAADKGGDEGMRDLAATARRLGFILALHENYVDYYPNYDHFDPADISLDSAGQRVLAWYNPGTRIQSFAIQPNAILRLARTQSPEIRQRFGTNACFLDVHSAVPPWFHVDQRAGSPGAGTYRRVMEAHRDLWAYEREVHRGPVFGEGNNHWYWSGLLDGVEAQFGTGWPENQGETAPLMPLFNLTRVQPLQINHGMGYYERWWTGRAWGSAPSMAVLDRYRMQEVVYGHAGFLGAAVWDTVPLAWQEHHLMTPVTAAQASSPVRSMAYRIGDVWCNPSEAAIQNAWSRPWITYANGLQVIANGSKEDWRVHGATLPPDGWLAYGPGLTAYTARRDGVIVDFAETPDRVFANARPASDWNLSGVVNVRPSVGAYRQTDSRTFEVTYRWAAETRLDRDFRCFVHFSRPGQDQHGEGIRFQQDHTFALPTTEWSAGSVVEDGPYTVRIPDDIADGEYQWSIGLFTDGGPRAAILGPRDPTGRILLGTLRIGDGGRSVEFIPARYEARSEVQSTYTDRVNRDERVVTFSALRTNGSVLIVKEGDGYVLRTWPRTGDRVVELRTSRYAMPSSVQSDSGAVRPIRTGDWWRLPLNGAAEYRWKEIRPASRDR